MKRKLSSVFWMWFAFGFGVAATLCMFLPFMQGSNIAGTAFGTHDATFYFFSSGLTKGAWTTFVGYMLILVSAIALGIMALSIVQPSEKVEKIVLISAIVLTIVGAALIGLNKLFYSNFNNGNVTLKNYYAGYFMTLAFALVAAFSTIKAATLDW